MASRVAVAARDALDVVVVVEAQHVDVAAGEVVDIDPSGVRSARLDDGRSRVSRPPHEGFDGSLGKTGKGGVGRDVVADELRATEHVRARAAWRDESAIQARCPMRRPIPPPRIRRKWPADHAILVQIITDVFGAFEEIDRAVDPPDAPIGAILPGRGPARPTPDDWTRVSRSDAVRSNVITQVFAAAEEIRGRRIHHDPALDATTRPACWPSRPGPNDRPRILVDPTRGHVVAEVEVPFEKIGPAIGPGDDRVNPTLKVRIHIFYTSAPPTRCS